MASSRPSAETASATSLLSSSLPVGALSGAGAYLLGYLITYLLVIDTVRGSIVGRLTGALAGEPTAWKLVGWILYNAHFVTTTVDVPVLGGTTAINLVAESPEIPDLLYALPPLLLVAAGLAVARQTLDAGGPRAAARAGATVVAGYFPLAVLGVFLFGVAAGDTTAGPNAITGVLLAGVVYPTVFGLIGSFLADVT